MQDPDVAHLKGRAERHDLFPSTVDEEIACVEREIRLRLRVYPRRVADGKMTQKLADKELAAMNAVLRRLHEVKGR